MTIAVLYCPGRGSYGAGELGAIAATGPTGAIAEALARADDARRQDGRPTVSELDAAERFRPSVHLDGENAAELIYFATLCDVERLREQYEFVAVAGNSLGWYTALPVAGCLSPVDGWRLVATMARLQKLAKGGQLLTTTLREDWTTDPELVAAIDTALRETRALGDAHFVARSILLGAHEVLAGTEAGVERLLEVLPEIRTKERSFPFRLAGHGPFHTELCREVAVAAVDELGNLPMREPETHLIDGRGDVHTPWSASPAELLHYTLSTQVTTTFDFTAATRAGIREFCPDVLLCAGPGTSLRAPVSHVALREGYRAITTKQELFAAEIVRV